LLVFVGAGVIDTSALVTFPGNTTTSRRLGFIFSS